MREKHMPGQKGVVWLVVAVGVLLLVEVLIFSLFFSELTLQKREVTDATIVYEGSELEVFARSIDNSIELSMAQGMYDFYTDYKFALWRLYDQKTMPDDGAIASQIQSNSESYVKKFIDVHKNFAEATDIDFVQGGGASTFKLERNFAKMTLPSMTLTKTIIALFDGTYERSFVPESSITTVFGDVVSYVRTNFVDADRIGDYSVKAIGYPDGKRDDPEMCKNRDREATEPRELPAYIDQDTSCTYSSGEPGSGSCFKTGQTTTRGALIYCTNVKTTVCAEIGDEPCPNFSPKYSPDPSAEEVYMRSVNGGGYSAAVSSIETHTKERMLCLEAEMDYETPKYTVAYDGNTFETSLDNFDGNVQRKGLVTGSCQSPTVVGDCDGRIIGTCGTIQHPKTLWECNEKRKIVCDYSHYIKTDVAVRVQEDGFVYGLWDKAKSQQVADTLKLVFKVTVGNGGGVIK